MSDFLLSRKLLFWISADRGVDLAPTDYQLNPWTMYTVYHPLESADTEAFFSLWREYNPLGHFVGKKYYTMTITSGAAQRNKIFTKMREILQFEGGK